ncbi:MAG TPA: DNA polymerase IV [Polyangiaceae bacterium]|nr:DNA polymerase IV [Polyangiaceae bacterium]
MAAPLARICCLDLDTFFVSVERLFDPSLVGRPVIVGGRPRERGVVTACSYEVRQFGVRSGMSLTEAARLAPNAVFLPTRDGVYSDYARRVVAIAERYSPVVQVASIDELYMDLSGCERLYREARDPSDDHAIERKVKELTDAIKREEGLPASAGVASSKRMAKVASALAKPNGVLFVAVGDEARVLAPLPVRKLPGIGPVAERKLADAGISTLGQLAELPRAQLVRVFGAWADQIQLGARGQGSADLGRERPAFREHDPVGEAIGSISNEQTFREDVRDTRSIERVLSVLSERVCFRARKRGVEARTVTLKLRYADFHTLTRAHTLLPTNSELRVFPVVRELFLRARMRPLPIRLLGIALSNLRQHAGQLSLFGDTRRLHDSVDQVRDRFGYDALRLASSEASKAPRRAPT